MPFFFYWRSGASVLFEEAFHGGRRYPGRFFTMWIRSGAGASLRLGVVAGRRTFRKSVERSRAKRLMREAFRLNRSRFTGEVDVILSARRGILDVSCQEVERDLLGVARRANLLPRGQR